MAEISTIASSQPASKPAPPSSAVLLNLALTILQARVMVLAPMILAFVLFAWAMYLPSPMTAVLASLFAVFVFLPILLLFRGASHGD